MSKRPYQHLPPLEHRPDGSPYRITPPQKRRASGLIRREVLQLRGRKLPCAGRWRHLRLSADDFVLRLLQVVPLGGLAVDRTLEAEIYRDRDLKRCAECGGVFVPKSNRGKYCPDCAARVHRRQKTESERKGGLLWTVKSGKSLDLQGSASPQPGRLVSFIIRPGKGL